MKFIHFKALSNAERVFIGISGENTQTKLKSGKMRGKIAK